MRSCETWKRRSAPVSATTGDRHGTRSRWASWIVCSCVAANPPAILLMGPTASGKTAVALELARTLPVEIVSVDSALVYKELDIGTAKPDRATLATVPHHLVDIIEPHETYSAARFRDDALAAMREITERERIPLL